MSHELAKRYAELSEAFIALAKGCTPEQLVEADPEGQWNRAFILHHMADADTHFSARYWHVLTLDLPPLTNFDEEIYPDRLRYAQRSALDSLAAIEGIYRMNANVFSLLEESDWQRKGIHSSLGELTLGQILGYAIDHRDSHLSQFAKVGR